MFSVLMKLHPPLHSEPQAMCYTETSNLDGETNLKIRQVYDFVGRFLHNSLFYCNLLKVLHLHFGICGLSVTFCDPLCFSGSFTHGWFSEPGGFDGAVWSFGV